MQAAYAEVMRETGRPVRYQYRPGDLVVNRTSMYPVLCEVICVQDDGLLRLRGLDWPPGYTALVAPEEVRSVSQLAQTHHTH